MRSLSSSLPSRRSEITDDGCHVRADGSNPAQPFRSPWALPPAEVSGGQLARRANAIPSEPELQGRAFGAVPSPSARFGSGRLAGVSCTSPLHTRAGPFLLYHRLR